jgi:hypothetical protein
MDTTPTQPMTAERLATIETAANSPAGLSDQDIRDLLAETRRARAAADEQHTEADYWCEGYRLAKGLSYGEIGAVIAVRDASKAHSRLCRFPHEACDCDA